MDPTQFGPDEYRSWPGISTLTREMSYDEYRSALRTFICPGCGGVLDAGAWTRLRAEAEQRGYI